MQINNKYIYIYFPLQGSNFGYFFFTTLFKNGRKSTLTHCCGIYFCSLQKRVTEKVVLFERPKRLKSEREREKKGKLWRNCYLLVKCFSRGMICFLELSISSVESRVWKCDEHVSPLHFQSRCCFIFSVFFYSLFIL